ncbi:hypothetical protein NE237_002652 [Protea cynaroides]|uniref:Uncharacterized protein n=1 Tax=Protea cynaroides TaxID=273540 RepID=A0A9Q0GMW4_9MAGN|nr:hypothetical protein NE237_002652 [Protea cynaroides]
MMNLMAGLPDPQLETSVLAIIVNTGGLMFNNISLGLSGKASTRVSNELSVGRTQVTRVVVRSILLTAIASGTILGFPMTLFSNIWGSLFSNEENVVRYVSRTIPLLVASIFLDGFQCALTQVL